MITQLAIFPTYVLICDHVLLNKISNQIFYAFCGSFYNSNLVFVFVWIGIIKMNDVIKSLFAQPFDLCRELSVSWNFFSCFLVDFKIAVCYELWT